MLNRNKTTKLILLFGSLTACASTQKDYSQDYEIKSNIRTPISITSFKNGAARTEDTHCKGWYWFNSNLGSSFTELAQNELMNYRRFEVLERQDIHKIYEDEVELVNSSKSTPIEKGKFIKAKYTISGTVNEFEYCAGRSNVASQAANILTNSIIGAGFDQEKSKVGVTLRLIDTSTGKVIASHKGMGEQKRTAIKGGYEMKNFDIGMGNYDQTSLSLAIEDAIKEALNGLIKKANI
jgi:curli biogenesis system outer membrane secretion channel CsgG